MEYCSGGNLLSYLTNSGEILKENSVKEISSQLLSAIKFLHKYGIVHRDIKLDNILLFNLSDLFNIKLIDFGLSTILSYSQFTNEAYGSLCYSAPEIHLEIFYNHKIDIWSFGIVLYFLLSGFFPFDDYNNCYDNIIYQIINKKVSFPNYSCFLFSSFEVKELINNCLEKDFDKRFNALQAENDLWFMN